MALWKKQKAIIHKIEEYFESLDECAARFKECMSSMIKQGKPEDYRENVRKVSELESKADDLRRAIEHELYERALIPESRGDILGLLESVDKIPNSFESVCYQTLQERILFPDQFKENFLKLIDKNISAYESLKEASIGFFYNRNIQQHLQDIDTKESESDKIERELIESIFTSKLDKADRILLKELVVNIGNISDLALGSADRLTIAVIKRRI